MDETGNTGLNHFDEVQPFFILGAAASTIDLDSQIKNDIDHLKIALKVPELHAAELGLDAINSISDKLVEIIQKNNISFHFSLVEKRYHLAIMIFHLIYDPGINPAASNHGFIIKQLRMTLSYNFLRLIDEIIINEFWQSTQKNDVDLFVSSLKKIKKNIALTHMDIRSKELLSDALQYTIDQPSEIFTSITFKKSVSSNISAFTSMFNTLHEVYGKDGFIIPKVIHDEQKEFGHSMRKAFEIVSQVQIPTDFDSLIVNTSSNALLKLAVLNLVPSNTSSGVQLIDLILWSFKRMTYKENHNLNPRLTSVIFKKAHINGNTFAFHEQTKLQGAMEIAEKTITPEELEKAKALIAELEAKRWKEKK